MAAAGPAAAPAGGGGGGGGLSFPAYFALSASVAAAVVSYAFQTRAQFYPAVIYLVTSKPAMLVLGNMGACFAFGVTRKINGPVNPFHRGAPPIHH